MFSIQKDFPPKKHKKLPVQLNIHTTNMIFTKKLVHIKPLFPMFSLEVPIPSVSFKNAMMKYIYYLQANLKDNLHACVFHST